MNLIVIAPPELEPVALADAKTWLRVDAATEDAAIGALIVAARMLVEATTRRALVTQSWRAVLDRWPFTSAADGSLAILASPPSAAQPEVRLPLAPVASVSAIRVYDANGQPQSLAASTWRLAGAPDQARLVFSAPPPQPGRTAAGIEIDIVAGYGVASDAPAPLRQAILMLVALWYENRGDGATALGATVPLAIAALLAPYMRGRLA